VAGPAVSRSQPGALAALPAPAGSWPFDEGEGETARDVSGHGHNMTLHGEATWILDHLTVPPRVVLDLPGRSGSTAETEFGKAVIPGSPARWSASVWVNQRPAANYRTVLSLEDPAGSWKLNLGYSDTKHYFMTLRPASNVGDRVDSPGTYTEGRWFLLTVVYDRPAGHARLFVNGGQVAQLGSPPVVPLGGRVVVGRAGNDSYLDGMVRDVRVWDTALSNDQVTELYDDTRAELPSVPAGTGPVPNAAFVPFSVSDSVGLQVNAGSGNALVTTSDLTVPGMGTGSTDAMTFGAAYNSLMLASQTPVGSLGAGWRTRAGPDVALYAGDTGNIRLMSLDGVSAVFTSAGGTAYHSPGLFQATLTRNYSGCNSGRGWGLRWHQDNALWCFDAGGQLTFMYDRNGNRWRFDYNGAGELDLSQFFPRASVGPTRKIDATWTDGRQDQLTWAPAGASARHVAYHFSDDNLTEITQPDGTEVKFGYNAAHDLTEITNGNGAVTRLGYDTHHRVLWVEQEADGGTPAVTRFAYPSDSETLAAAPSTDQSDPVASVPHVRYYIDTSTKLVTKVSDQQGYVQSFSWTSFYALKSYTNALGGTFTNDYNANGGQSLTKSAQPTGASATCAYANVNTRADPTGSFLPSHCTDAQANPTTFAYDGPGNLISATSAESATAKVDYNTDGTVKSSTDPANGTNATRYHYTDGRMLDEVTPVTGSSLHDAKVSYNPYGLPETVTDGAGHTTRYTYDAMGRVTGVSVTGGPGPVDVTLTYDKAGNLTGQDSNGQVTTWTYDDRNQMTGWDAGPGQDSTYLWNTDGLLATVTQGDGTTRYVYDTRGLLAAMVDPAGHQWTFSYNGDGQRTLTRFNATIFGAAAETTDHYDNAGRLSRIVASRGSPGGGGTVKVLDLTFCYVKHTPPATCPETPTTEDRSLLQSITNQLAGDTSYYTYDKANRLTKATHVDGHDYDYTYNKNGNLTEISIDGHKVKDWGYNPANQISSDGYSYDGAGNATQTLPDVTLRYSDASQMTSATHAATTQHLTYNGTSQTQVTSISGTATSIGYGLPGPASYTLPDGQQVWIIYDSTGTPLGLYTDGHSYAYITDNLGSVRAIISDTGGASASYNYDPYGTTITATGDLATVNLLRYTGALTDPTAPAATLAANPAGTGYIHLGYRWYNPATGSFTQQDPATRLANPANGNRYAYAAGNPVNYTDPAGLCALSAPGAPPVACTGQPVGGGGGGYTPPPAQSVITTPAPSAPTPGDPVISVGSNGGIIGTTAGTIDAVGAPTVGLVRGCANWLWGMGLVAGGASGGALALAGSVAAPEFSGFGYGLGVASLGMAAAGALQLGSAPAGC
jgi:RHS repeat-associated protein